MAAASGEEPAATFVERLRIAAGRTLLDRRLLWALVAVLTAARVFVEIPVFMPLGADVFAFLDVGRQVLSHPGAIYPQTVEQIAQGHVFGVLAPPPQLLVAALYALLPASIGPGLWVGTNTLASAAALIALRRAIGSRDSAITPIFLLVVLCFTPLFEDIRLGQRGGVLMILSVGAMAWVQNRPRAAGVLAGLASAFKFYPAAMVLGVGPPKRWAFISSLGLTGALVLGLSFIPFGSPLFYLRNVLLPSLTWQNAGNHDCFQNSTPLLFARVVGGESFSVINKEGVWREVAFIPWHLHTLATVLTYLTLLALVAGTIWAVRRTGAAQPYSLALCFSLGTLIPGEVFTYQFLPMLPLTLVLFIKCVGHRMIGTLAVLGVALWVLLLSPCALPLPSLWTVAALAIFGLAVWRAPTFRH